MKPVAPLSAYLASSEHIDATHPLIAARAQTLAAGAGDEREVAARCFHFVRDEIRHSWDFRQGPLTCSASAVLRHGTGYCYAKSHLLAALLRANGIAAGLCYQRLSVNDSGPPYCLHGLNAVLLPEHGWYRLDARGNKPGVAAHFTPPHEALAFALREAEECDFAEIWPEPLPVVVEALLSAGDIETLHAALPDQPPQGR
ncbi:transglutaminase family protein [Uliginosibacterium sediminicola]|uniref:Transglutaminase family protein n=1 Tax=Uliginosibacterium sediminicola TaxID=2024550 RepID=A0ABU9Z2W4_9RHOO